MSANLMIGKLSGSSEVLRSAKVSECGRYRYALTRTWDTGGGQALFAGVCRECGCTDSTPCTDDDGEACSWTEPDLCSACASKAKKPAAKGKKGKGGKK